MEQNREFSQDEGSCSVEKGERRPEDKEETKRFLKDMEVLLTIACRPERNVVTASHRYRKMDDASQPMEI